MKGFERLFEPQSIAVVGVSDDPVRPASQTLHTLLRYGFGGRVHPVNPRYSEYEGLRCYPTIDAIEEDIDVAVIGVPARGVIPVIEGCAKKRVPFAVVLSGGFGESGAEGIERQKQMLAIARAANIRIVGPNCLGIANIHRDVYAAFVSMTRPPRLERGSLSLVTQSGGFGVSLALACATAGIGFRNVIATGNEADIGAVEFIDALVDDPETDIILAYIEGLNDARGLLECGRRALHAGKPLIVWKGGVTDDGARAAATHTANLTGRYDYCRALFRQAGIIEITEVHEAADFVKAFQARRFPRGRQVAVMGGSGGSAIVFADAAQKSGLRLATFAEDTRRRIAEVIPAIGAVHNPVDFTAGYIGADDEKLSTAVHAVLDDAAVDAACFNLATSAASACHAAARVLTSVVAGTTKPLFVFLALPESDAAAALSVFRSANIPVLPSPVRVARAIATLASYREALEQHRRADDVGRSASAAGAAEAVPSGGGALSEVESKAVLQRSGIAVTRDVVVRSAADVDFAALSPPLAVKILSSDIAHKTDIGGVKLDVRTPDELRAAIDEVLANARLLAPQARVEGVLLSEMVKGGFELLAGVVNDVVFGPVVVVGAGGINTEVFRDTACRIAPFGEETAREMLGELGCRRILDGTRGRPALDVAAVARTLALLSQLAWHNRARISEIDINPLIVLPSGAVAADALIILNAAGEGDASAE